ncbi:HD domain-containing protein [Sphingorhabdus sp. EL138]|uniref:HD domain-containing protein n=1 Tax=Sphingorhabdus sp. EL138 TaxID=2073156 RepID=UPI000D68771A|nr:HD domain-containing protein [Sphingorhabdus sp. EL138]
MTRSQSKAVLFSAIAALGLVGCANSYALPLDREVAKEVQFPSTPATQLAEDLLNSYSGEVMVGHVKRSYLFAKAFAEKEQSTFDEELVYIALLLHDLGLEDPYDKGGDFEQNGAQGAYDMLSQVGRIELADDVKNAINLHTDPATAQHQRYEYALVARGALADVVGAGLDQLPPEKVSEIVSRYPRAGTKELLIAMLERQARFKPDSRIGQTYSQVPVSDLIRRSPFED